MGDIQAIIRERIARRRAYHGMSDLGDCVAELTHLKIIDSLAKQLWQQFCLLPYESGSFLYLLIEYGEISFSMEALVVGGGCGVFFFLVLGGCGSGVSRRDSQLGGRDFVSSSMSPQSETRGSSSTCALLSCSALR